MMSLKKKLIKNYIKMQLLSNMPGELHIRMANLNKGVMLREIDEALGSTMELNIFYDHQLRVCEKGINVGFETVGKLEEL